MADNSARKQVKEAELQAAIMERLSRNPDCAGIVAVYVRRTGKQPPEETWAPTIVSRRPTIPKTNTETSALNAILNDMRKEFDLFPD
jgi:hypothetical protein